MDTTSLTQFKSAVIKSNGNLSDDLRISKAGRFETFYAPFEYINPQARLVLCGITPGRQQARNALLAARDALEHGKPDEEALREAKETASFSGPMRDTLVALLNSLQVGDAFGLNSCSELFGEARNLVHYTSLLRFPVLKDGVDYRGSTEMTTNSYLWSQIKDTFTNDLANLPRDALILPLGSAVSRTFDTAISYGLIDPHRVLKGLPHPSGANAERIAYFLGRKAREALSDKVNAAAMDHAKEQLLSQLQMWRSKLA